MENLLSKIYYDPSNPGSFSSAEKLFEEAKLKNGTLTLKEVKDWLSGELTYTLHKPVRKTFGRNRVIISRPNEQWQADLVDLQEFSKQNNGFKYLLTVIDVFSRYAYVIPLKNKTGKAITDAFKHLFKLQVPSKIQTDRGKEFVNKDFLNFISKYGVELFHSQNQEIKCALVERYNRTLKSKMFKYFTSKGKRKYIDVLQKFVQSYNNTRHRSIGMKPSEVSFENRQEIFKNLYGFSSMRELLKKTYAAPKFKMGDKVRIKYNTKNFDRGYYPNWTDQIFSISAWNKRLGRILYRITDENNQTLEKRFYSEELQKIKENLFRVEKIIKRRMLNGQSQIFVKWLNYPESFNSWIPSANLIKG